MRMNIYVLKGVGGTCGYEDKDSTRSEYQGGHWSVAYGVMKISIQLSL